MGWETAIPRLHSWYRNRKGGFSVKVVRLIESDTGFAVSWIREGTENSPFILSGSDFLAEHVMCDIPPERKHSARVLELSGDDEWFCHPHAEFVSLEDWDQKRGLVLTCGSRTKRERIYEIGDFLPSVRIFSRMPVLSRYSRLV